MEHLKEVKQQQCVTNSHTHMRWNSRSLSRISSRNSMHLRRFIFMWIDRLFWFAYCFLMEIGPVKTTIKSRSTTSRVPAKSHTRTHARTTHRSKTKPHYGPLKCRNVPEKKNLLAKPNDPHKSQFLIVLIVQFRRPTILLLLFCVLVDFLGPRGDTFNTYKTNINIDLRSFHIFIYFHLAFAWLLLLLLQSRNVVVVFFLPSSCCRRRRRCTRFLEYLNNKTATINLCEFQGFFHPGWFICRQFS